ncbi:hypothetical protein lbkm_4179 [Lachnospiraceae bacterium KM106-2]|nr:hypothetical protein lbkm_4179 [Lachnospiraceae bacterium KM106-2]
MDQFVSFMEFGHTAVISFNYTGISGEQIFEDENENYLWDKLSIPFYNIVVDHPFYYPKLLSHLPKRYAQFSIDKDHENYMKRFYPEVIDGGFLPLGGTHYPGSHIPYEDRDIDVMFAGNYTPPAKFNKFIDRLDDEYAAFYQDIIKDLIAHPDTSMEKAFEGHLKKEIPKIKDQELRDTMANMTFIDLYVRFYFRGEVIRTLAESGIHVHTFGGDYDYLECKKREYIHPHGSVDSATCLYQMGRSKISINVMPWFKVGAHDRIFNTMLNGAVCVTDGSEYIDSQFTDGEDICLYSLKEIKELPDKVRDLLAHPDKAAAMTYKAYEKAERLHTWECRAKQLHEVLKIEII